MLIQVLGPGCDRCKQLHNRVMQAVMETNLDADVEKVEDMAVILKCGVMATPAMVVDGLVKFSGKVPSVDELKKMLKG